MKKLLLFLVALLALGVPARAAYSYDFIEDNFLCSEISWDEKTIAIVGFEKDPGGDVVIPSELAGYTVVRISGFDHTTITSVTIPNTVTKIGSKAFQGCTSLESVTIPNSVTTISDWAFEGCTSLESVTIPNSVTEIYSGAFRDCTSLKSVTISNSLTSIEFDVFRGCSSLEAVTIPNSVTEIGDLAFYNCTSLTTVTFVNPNENLKISDDSFENTPGITAVNFTGDFTIKAGTFNNLFGSGSITALYFNGNYTIDESAFEGIDLKVLEFNGKSDIKNKAFKNSNAARIYLEDCAGIGEQAFATDKYKYKNFYLWCFNEVPPVVMDENAFSGLPKDGDSPINTQHSIIYVPAASFDKYLTAYGWTYFNTTIGDIMSDDVFVGMGTLESLTFDPSGEIHVDERESFNITYDAKFTDGYEFSETTWLSSDESVVAVNSTGGCLAKKSGMALIYFRYTNNYGITRGTAATLVTVGDVDFSLSLEPENEEIAVGTTTKVKTVYGGDGYTVASEKWSTSNPNVATVDENGVVTAVAKGEATITLAVTFDNGITVPRSCKVTVTDNNGNVAIESIEATGGNARAEFFNLNGVRVNGDALAPGLYIKRQGGNVSKVLVK